MKRSICLTLNVVIFIIVSFLLLKFYLKALLSYESFRFYFTGYIYIILAGGYFIKTATDELVSEQKRSDHAYSTDSWFSVVLGVMERIMYLTSLIIHQEKFIGIWLAFKVVGRFTDKIKNESQHKKLSTYLIGNALSIIYAYAGYMIIIYRNNLEISMSIAAGVVLGTLFLEFLARVCKKAGYFKPA